jgi:hypothetical protein
MAAMRKFTVLFPLAVLGSAVQAGERVHIEVKETAGIRRFGYPLSVELGLERPVAEGAKFRLLDGDKPIPAQFRRLEKRDGQAGGVSIDFEGSFLPFEARRYAIEIGPDVAASPEPGGLTIEELADAYRVRNGPHLAWEIPKSLAGLLRSVKTPEAEYLRPDSAGMLIRTKSGALHPVAGALRSRVVKAGPFDCVIRFESDEDLGGKEKVASTIDLEFPRSKSWVRVGWKVTDPEELADGLGTDLRLHVEGERTLVDFGADGLVYAALEKGQAAAFRAGLPTLAHRLGNQPFWEVLRGAPPELEPYAASGLTGVRRCDGWAHVMDRERTTAVAVAEFARRTQDRIEVESSGRLQVWRDFRSNGVAQPPARDKSLLFWLHFVTSPPHVGAVTSPQSMQAPLEVTVIPDKPK